MNYVFTLLLLLLLLSRFSRVRLCATPETAAHQAPPSLGFSRQEHWSGVPFPSPMHDSEKWKWSRSVVSDSWRPHGLQPTRLLHPWDLQARVLEWGAIAFSIESSQEHYNLWSTVPFPFGKQQSCEKWEHLIYLYLIIFYKYLPVILWQAVVVPDNSQAPESYVKWWHLPSIAS